MKNSKGIIALLTAVVLAVTLVACSASKDHPTEKITQAVTDENGEFVTNENGEVVTELVESEVATDSNGKSVTEVVTNKKGEPVTNSKGQAVTQVVTRKTTTTTKKGNGKNDKTTDKNNKPGSTDNNGTTKKPVKKPKKPANVSSLKASDIKQTSVKLTWGKVNCDGYQIAYSDDKGATWHYLEEEYKSTSYIAGKLTSDTVYKFRVRAYNGKKDNRSASKWKEVSATTKAQNISRNITFNIILPTDGNAEDTVSVYVDGKLDGEMKVNLNGNTVQYTTKKKYKGKVGYKIVLKNSNTSREGATDKEKWTVNISSIGIDVVDGEDD